MTSWHHTSCATPEVIVEDDTLRCETCSSVAPSVRDLAAQRAARSSSIAIPPDELPGQMNLWWPPGVPYESRLTHVDDPLRDSRSDSPAEVVLEHGAPQELEPSPAGGQSPSTTSVYGTALAADEFRLLCLYSTDDEDDSSPLHVTLEVYQHDDCPEYEAVSYTWGGENGNSTPCRPIFIGPRWDILLQTKNCYDMLRYLRPWKRGIRMVWVDAICINQDDPTERAQQVAKMGMIYQNCSRVFVYLGSNIVSRPTRRHPARYGLHEFDQVMGGTGGVPDGVTRLNLRKLLTRRYFSRVWVIQELLRSRNAVIPVGDTQFWASNLTAEYLDFDWDSTAAPWLRFMGGSSFHQNELLLALRRTWLCEASDPRDRIFGILGLLRSSEGQDSLVPDYRISTRHTFIGVFAHILINFGVASVLMSASGLAAPPGYPSWAPHWESSRALGGSRSLDDSEELTEKRFKRARPAWMHVRRNLCSADTTPVFLSPFSLQLWMPELAMPWNEYLPEQDHWNICLKSRSSVPEEYDPGRSWRHSASVDSSTGALTTRLIHLFQFDASPSSTEITDLYEVIAEPCALYIMTEEGGPQLDALIPPGPNHLFCLEKEGGDADDPDYLLVFMRELESGPEEAAASTVRSFKLILCCPCDDMFLLFPDKQHAGTPLTPEWHHISLFHTLYCAISEYGERITWPRSDGALDGITLHDVIASLQSHSANVLRTLFPGPRQDIALQDFIPIFQGLLNESYGQEPGFVEAYIKCLHEMLPHIGVKVTVHDTDPCIELTLMREDAAEYWWSYCNDDSVLWHWRYTSAAPGSEWRSCLTDKLNPPNLKLPSESVSLRASIQRLTEVMEGTYFYHALRSLRFATAAARVRGELPNEDELTMLMRGPRPEDYLVPLRHWPPAVVESFAADGVPWEVRIV
ncbi:heterokaryon incompatibility protein-domain-containing protein [Apodospora peruviana]|uniref:Heterokaryon incompatibility protein-domain-containing protein n=1 Tax=Apodospora peruviana TaxID=516989 RepID=A0AAE0HTS1_9PEZI|nr:heterokaryon incompatibility protein-domain-containing protein [Apodospora peruviana]